MKKTLLYVIVLIVCGKSYGQADTIKGEEAAKLAAQFTKDLFDTTKFLSESAGLACHCIDSISLVDKTAKQIAAEASDCIDKQVAGYELSIKLFRAMTSGGKNNEISISNGKDSREYKVYYYRIESWLRDSCRSLGKALASNNKESEKSVSSNENALAAYARGVEEMMKQNHKDARDYFKTAVALDPKFAFAWDNLGLCHRKLGELDEALAAYKKSLEVDPSGKMPMQNIAIVYEYKKDYANALKAYQDILNVYPKDPEAWYGEGRIYIFFNTDYEKALQAMCKAYNLYIELNSPYRVDAEKNISYIYGKMKEEGKEKRFHEILKENKITAN